MGGSVQGIDDINSQGRSPQPAGWVASSGCYNKIPQATQNTTLLGTENLRLTAAFRILAVRGAFALSDSILTDGDQTTLSNGKMSFSFFFSVFFLSLRSRLKWSFHVFVCSCTCSGLHVSWRTAHRNLLSPSTRGCQGVNSGL